MARFYIRRSRQGKQVAVKAAQLPDAAQKPGAAERENLYISSLDFSLSPLTGLSKRCL